VIVVSPSDRQISEADRLAAMRWAATVLVGVAVCAVPLWLWHVPLSSYVLKSDDFGYLVTSRTATAFRRHLFTPHHAHVVPLFRLETHLLARLAGSLEALPVVLGWGSYATLVLAALLTGHLVARETGRPAPGLVAMAAIGFSSVLGPSLLWYSASQALAAGVMILVMLAALQSWRVRGSWWLLASGLLAAIAAPLLWTAGYAAGPVGAAYLFADGRRSCRRAAVLPLAVSVGTFFLVWVSTIFTRTQMSPFSGAIVRIENAVVHSAQAVCESLVLKNLGLDATTTASQALALLSLLTGFWIWSHYRLVARQSSIGEPGNWRHSVAPWAGSAGTRPEARESRPTTPQSNVDSMPGPRGSGAWPRINPLEAAGAVLVAGSYGMIYAARETVTSFESVRVQGWYDAIPELGAVLFVCGWFAGRLESPPPRALKPPERREILVVVLIIAVILLFQQPRIERVIYRYDGMGAAVAPELLARMPLRTPVDLAQSARSQRQALAALDRLEQSAREQRVSRAAVRRAVDHISVEGMPGIVADPSALDLLDIPSTE
jgi:hypothetical protein